MTEEDDMEIFDNVFTQTPSIIDELVAEDDSPSQDSPEWHEYVMGFFDESELMEINGKKYPNCYGLRRVVRQLMGEIIVSRPVVVAHPEFVCPKTVITYEVSVRKHNGQVISYGDVASVSEINTDDLFLGYAEETAATRAEGRCLRKILMLKCVAAEELTKDKNVSESVAKNVKTQKSTDGTYSGEDKITSNQIAFINNLAKDLVDSGFDFSDFVSKLDPAVKKKVKGKGDSVVLENLTKNEASKHFIQPLAALKNKGG